MLHPGTERAQPYSAKMKWIGRAGRRGKVQGTLNTPTAAGGAQAALAAAGHPGRPAPPISSCTPPLLPFPWIL